jgi:hypothetical protein
MHQTVRCGLVTVGEVRVSPADRVADRWLDALLAHQTVQWGIGQSGGAPDSPVNFSRGALSISRERPVHRGASMGTGHCPVYRRLAQVWLSLAKLLQFHFSHFEKFPST